MYNRDHTIAEEKVMDPMRQAVVPAQYLQIALDLATRIAQGELAEGSRIYGRSVMASEYGCWRI